jgi:hypothetical protein
MDVLPIFFYVLVRSIQFNATTKQKHMIYHLLLKAE